MVIKKGDWFRYIGQTYQRHTKGNLYLFWHDTIENDYGLREFINECSLKKSFQKLYTLEDLKSGKVAVENDGTVKELREVVRFCIPRKDRILPSGDYKFYHLSNVLKWGWFCTNSTDLPTQSVKDFLVQLPKEDTPITPNPIGTDPINPDHYKSYSVECIDMMVAIYGPEKAATHCELTAFKYRMRAGKRDSVDQDLKKEEWYLNKAKELRNEK